MFSFTLEKVADIMEFRAVLEDYLLCRAAENIRPGDLDRLRQLLECQQTEDSVWEHWQSNEDFHLQLASLARNEYCCQQLERSMRLLKLAYAQFYWSQWNSADIPNDLKNHRSILDGLEQGTWNLPGTASSGIWRISALGDRQTRQKNNPVLCFVHKTGLFFSPGSYSNWEAYSR